ncbi:hypothetical protein E2562_033385 [Oryza meyeriana var. granulata]|uniref:DUF834 domain-containing protein n=1 Tax=Oryza meyeriana var. granulata TaxID=110450 RepID=A0A6G1C0K9_9ORYZ|nr:hypothetical protein E2562_033385 [Oryza meyeriana var. granulata]
MPRRRKDGGGGGGASGMEAACGSAAASGFSGAVVMGRGQRRDADGGWIEQGVPPPTQPDMEWDRCGGREALN